MKMIEAAVQNMFDGCCDGINGLRVVSVTEDDAKNTNGYEFSVTIKSEWGTIPLELDAIIKLKQCALSVNWMDYDDLSDDDITLQELVRRKIEAKMSAQSTQKNLVQWVHSGGFLFLEINGKPYAKVFNIGKKYGYQTYKYENGVVSTRDCASGFNGEDHARYAAELNLGVVKTMPEDFK